MGGCRCTYRNCTVKSDGQVHLFHYPVFDKLRCHQWLMNAHRLDFLDLRVSQLKNRVVCQHHFEDHNFMNYKKDKLKFDAVPTKDGPYCDKSEWSSQPVDVHKLCPIVPEDIENTYCTTYDKKTNYSLKYSDFLTNSDPSEISELEINNKDKFLNENPLHNIQTIARNDIVLKVEPNFIDHNLNNNTSQDVNKSQKLSSNIQPHDFIQIKNLNKSPTTRGKVNKSRIKIISEKKIRDPIPIKGKFKKLPPSVTLPPPQNKSLCAVPDIIPEKVMDIENKLNNITFDKSYVVQVEFDPSHNIRDPMAINNNTSSKVVQDSSIVEYPPNDVNLTEDKDKLQISFTTPNIPKDVPTSPQSKRLLRKVNLTPERKAAIDSKRQFNKLLRNVIQACLETKDGTEISKDCAATDKIEEISKQLSLDLKDIKKENKTKSTQKVIRTKPTVESQSILKPNTPVDANDSLLTFLESRLQTLESNVMHKIDQNAMQISEMKKQLSKEPPKDASTQTYENEESYKKFLFQEISQFLSPSCNSSVYEELFINKYSLKEGTTQPKAKRRKR
ncbi:uncharacterized protein LOC121733250 [Aricia agestis]|uniref:uncharacterized protein LOC121733250 n=1 Tax=Aricia agestis TaxID=91739 RepID=UPI001C20232F|nr:uncharacterized protein LOC121733250 [Aricia agestis]